MKKWFFAVTVVFPFMAFGLLPPLYESLAEYKSLINDERLPQSLDSGELIIDIHKDENIFLITTNKSTLTVRVIKNQDQKIGPTQFHLEFQRKVPST